MTQNIVGPFGPGVNATTSRPTDTEPEGASDSWFQPCIGGDPDTGTRVTHVWLNKVSALLRRAIRGRGVAAVATDDDMLLKAINSADRAVDNVGTGAGLIYAGLGESDGRHKMRRIKPGAGVTVDTNGDDIEISASGGEGGLGVTSQGDGVQIYNGNNGTNHLIRSLGGGGGNAVTANEAGTRVNVTAPGVDNVGTGVGVYKEMASGRHKMRSIKPGPGIAVAAANEGNEVQVSLSAGLGKLFVGSFVYPAAYSQTVTVTHNLGTTNYDVLLFSSQAKNWFGAVQSTLNPFTQFFAPVSACISTKLANNFTITAGMSDIFEGNPDGTLGAWQFAEHNMFGRRISFLIILW